jgi:hypothetical protein
VGHHGFIWLSRAESGRVSSQIDRLNGLANDAPPLPFPHTSQISGPLRELRCHYGRAHYRIPYRRSENHPAGALPAGIH